MYIYIKMVNRFYKKKQRKALKTSTWKTSKSFCGRKRKEKGGKRPETDIKVFLKKKKKKHHYHHNRNKNLSEEEKQKKVEYMRIYYLAYKENCKLFFQGSIK